MASLNRVGYGLTVAAHVPPSTFQVGEARFLTVRTPFGERVRTASALGRVRANGRTARMPIHHLVGSAHDRPKLWYVRPLGLLDAPRTNLSASRARRRRRLHDRGKTHADSRAAQQGCRLDGSWGAGCSALLAGPRLGLGMRPGAALKSPARPNTPFSLVVDIFHCRRDLLKRCTIRRRF